MKRYSKNPALIVLNIAIEYCLLFAVYIICGLIRVYISKSLVLTFYPYVIKMFIPIVLIISFLMVLIYFILGDYRFIHFKSAKRIFERTLIVSILGGLVLALSIFFTKGDVFSRALLIMLIPAWCLTIFIKRIFLEVLANKFFNNKIEACNVLLIGDSSEIKKYYGGLIGDNSTRYSFVGYVAEKKNKDMANYLGATGDIHRIITSNKIDKVVVSEVSNDKAVIKDILNLCSMYGIEVVVIPFYSEYITEGQTVKRENGVNCLTLNAGFTSDILGVNISVTDMEKTIEEIKDNLLTWKGKYICVSNVHTTVMAHDNPEYKAIQNGAIRALPDGGPLSAYSRAEGKIEARRVTGPDLMRECLMESKESGWRHFFYGSTDKTLNMLRNKIEQTYPGAIIAGMISPPYREITPQEDEEYIKQINDANPDFLWVGLGAPKQEIWMAAHQDKINALMIGVGAAFDYESGNLKRAPQWMQKCNLEWLYRFMQEPRRLFKRYFITNIKFLWMTRR